MKPAILISALSIFALLIDSQIVKASHAAGGEIYYEWVSDSTYRVYFKFYRDCAGGAEPATAPLCVRNTCTSTGFTVNMTKASSTGTQSTLSCAAYKTKCDSAQSTYSGNIAWLYSALITLPSRCSLWKMFCYVDHRSPSANLSSSSSGFYIEATLNNQVAQGNSSSYIVSSPLLYACLNTPTFYTFNALDPDNDVLVYEVINPLTGVTSCTDNAINGSFANSAYSIPSNPFATSNTFNLSSAGLLSFTSGLTGIHTLAIRIKEYRNSVLIGSVMRDMQLQVAACNGSIPTMAVDIASITGGNWGVNRVHACVNHPLYFCWDINISGSVFVNDNHTTAIPAAAITYTGQNTNTVRGCMTWTPTINDTGYKGLIITVTDSTCRPIGTGASHYQLSMPVYVWAAVDVHATPDTNICLGHAITLSATGTGSYTWTILPGGSASSLSCTTCIKPLAFPTVQTSYEVTNTTCSAKDTVTIGILPITYPSIAITALSTNAWPWLNVTFTAQTQNCLSAEYQWMVNGTVVPGATSAIWNVTTLVDGDKVSCSLKCQDNCPSPRDTTSNTLTMNVPVSVHNAHGELTGRLVVSPNPNNGSFMISELKNAKGDLEILNALGQEVYQDELNGENEKQVQLKGAAAGLYILRIKTGSEMLTTCFVLQQ